MKYLVIEIQTFEGGAVSTPTYAYDSEESALSKFFSLCAGASVSTLPVHSVVLMTNEGFQLRAECFKHEAVPAEPEQVED